MTSWLVWSALSGLEVPLFVVLGLWALRLHLQERSDPDRAPRSFMVLALGILARPEGALLWVLAFFDRLLTCRREPDGTLRLQPPPIRSLVVGVLVTAIVVGPVLAFNYGVSGSLLPTTFAAKSGGLARWLPELGYLYTVFGIFFQVQPWMALFAGAGVLVVIGRLGGPRDRGWLPAAWLLGLPLAYGLIDPPGPFNLVGNFGRYFFPLFPVAVLLGTLGIQQLAGTVDRWLRAGPVRVPWRALMLILLVLPTALELVQGAGRYGQNVLNVHDSDVRAARWLAPRLPPAALLAVADIGAIKFLLPNRVVDLAGIGNPEIRSWGVERFLDHYRPDYLVIFPNWLQRLVDEDAPFELVQEFPIGDNITMGGDVLAVYSTPWTRHFLTEPAVSEDRQPDR